MERRVPTSASCHDFAIPRGFETVLESPCYFQSPLWGSRSISPIPQTQHFVLGYVHRTPNGARIGRNRVIACIRYRRTITVAQERSPRHTNDHHGEGTITLARQPSPRRNPSPLTRVADHHHRSECTGSTAALGCAPEARLTIAQHEVLGKRTGRN